MYMLIVLSIVYWNKLLRVIFFFFGEVGCHQFKKKTQTNQAKDRTKVFQAATYTSE